MNGSKTLGVLSRRRTAIRYSNIIWCGQNEDDASQDAHGSPSQALILANSNIYSIYTPIYFLYILLYILYILLYILYMYSYTYSIYIFIEHWIPNRQRNQGDACLLDRDTSHLQQYLSDRKPLVRHQLVQTACHRVDPDGCPQTRRRARAQHACRGTLLLV